MSQEAAKRREYRAFFAIVGACALLFGLFSSGFAQASRSANFPFAAANHGGVFTCDLSGHATAKAGEGEQRPAHNPSGGGVCPGCCLSAHGAAAVMPERLSSVERPTRATFAHVSYFPASTRLTDSAGLGAANGARAPPARG